MKDRWSPLGAVDQALGVCRRLYDVSTQGRGRGLRLAALGMMVGLGLVVLRASNAASYLSNDPEACLNCHVMVPPYASWAHSSHRRVTVCNDCHVPHDGSLRKVAFKAMDGLRHATMFTLRLEPQVLILNEAARPVVQGNCVRCHERQVMVTALATEKAGRWCWSCHREVPHGLAQSLSSAPHGRRPRLPVAGLPRQERPPAGVPGRPSDKEEE